MGGVDAQYAEQMVMSISMQRVFSCISLIPLVEYSLRPLSLISMLTSYFLSLARHYYAVMHAHLSLIMQLSIFNLFSDATGVQRI